MAKEEKVYRITEARKIRGKWYHPGDVIKLDLVTAQTYHNALDPDPGPRPKAPPALSDTRLAEWMARQLQPKEDEDGDEKAAEPEAGDAKAEAEQDPAEEPEGAAPAVDVPDEAEPAEEAADEPSEESDEAEAEPEAKPKPKPRRRSRAKKS